MCLGPIRPAVLGLADLEALLEVGESVADRGVGCTGAEDQEQDQGDGGCPKPPRLRCHGGGIDRWQEDEVGGEDGGCCAVSGLNVVHTAKVGVTDTDSQPTRLGSKGWYGTRTYPQHFISCFMAGDDSTCSLL